MSYRERNRKALSTYEQLALIRQPNPGAPTGLRNLCLISLMLKTGIRVNELIKLRISDINWTESSIYIGESGAANKRKLMLGEDELKLLNKWLRVRKPNDENDFIFTTLDGKALKDRYIREMIKRLARKAGIEQDIYPHLLRYTFAFEFLKETRDLKLLQQALGHRDISATQAYARMFFDDDGYQLKSYRQTNRSGMPMPVMKKNGQEVKFEQASFLNGSGEKNDLDARTVLAKLESNIQGDKTFKNARPAGNSVDPVKKRKIGEPSANFRISFEEEVKPAAAIPIPPLKCHSCGYILHFQGGCPRCGTSLNKILKHWGKSQ